MSLQHVAATNHSVCTGRAISCCNKLRDALQREIASCVSENQKNFCENLFLPNRILSPQQIAGTQSHLILCDSLGRQNFVAESKFFAKFSSTLEAVCHRDVLQQPVAYVLRP